MSDVMNRKRIRIPTSIRAFFTTSKSQIITTEAKYIAHTKVFQEINYICNETCRIS